MGLKTFKIEEMDKNVEYTEYLHKTLKELKITQQELAKVVGKSQRTISGYISGDFPIPPEAKVLIDEYITQRRKSNGFEPLDSKEFADLLISLMEEFDITQQELARDVSMLQKNISSYCSAGLKKTIVPKEKQYTLLLYFYRRSKSNGQFLNAHFGTGVYLNNLLFGENENEVCDIEANRGDVSEYRDCISYILKFPIKLQNLMADNFGAFYDNIYELSVCHNKSFSFKHLSYAVELFRQLNREKQEKLILMLEEKAVDMFPKDDAEFCFFEHITEYRNVIQAHIPSLKADKNTVRNPKDEKLFINRLDVITSLNILSDKAFIDEADFKLAMNRGEWYLWMLLIIYEFKGGDVFLFCNDTIMPMIHEPKIYR